jgi:hypothetical protein
LIGPTPGTVGTLVVGAAVVVDFTGVFGVAFGVELPHAAATITNPRVIAPISCLLMLLFPYAVEVQEPTWFEWSPG